ncbi:MAG: tRNA pseudouridine(13) synthase TruD [Phycisphaeraceae bacterium]|nr:tRNA pseudouridine(13) synthase TruD [Phycisphaeraceae bacterium]
MDAAERRDLRRGPWRARTYVTPDVPGIGGRLRARDEDFLVEEEPLYEPCGSGEHIYLFIEKRSMTTLELVGVLARHFGVSHSAVGFAGLKDKRAITRQVMSVHVPGRSIGEFGEIRDDRVGVLWADKHSNKLRRGHLRGNRFSIRVRGAPVSGVVHARRVLERLREGGVPNRVGPQRFGYRENNHDVGRLLVLDDVDAAIDVLLLPTGDEAIDSKDTQLSVRHLYAQGDVERAARLMSPALPGERAALAVLARGGTRAQALRAVGRQALSYYLSSFQSAVFNDVLESRLGGAAPWGLVPGDIAMKHENRACFAVDDAVASDPSTAARTEALEIGPTGPMWGPGMMRAGGAIDESEVAALRGRGVEVAQIERSKTRYASLLDGARRALRVPVGEISVEGGVDEVGPYVRCGFMLPRGAFATTVMAEVMKNDLDGETS